MNIKISTIVILLFFLTFSVVAQGPLGIDGEESTSVGIFIKDIRPGTPEGERVLVDHNSQMALTPASVMKVVTTATALETMGADRRLETRVELRGRRAGATWEGNLRVMAVGDPTLESENFKENGGFCRDILAGLRKAAISRITGRIEVVQSLSDSGPILQWECEDIAWPYGAGLWGLNWRDNTFTLSPATGKTSPYVPDLKIDIRKSASGNDLVRGVASNTLVIYAQNPQNRKWVTKSTMPDPAAVFEVELEKTLREGGVTLGGKDVKDAGAETLEVCVHRSPRTGEIFKSLMVRSDNLFAEGMLRAAWPGMTRKKAIEAEKALWQDRGINARYTIINDGSGLTRANRLSPSFMADIMEWMAKSPAGKEFASYFPRAGKDGTMKGFLAKSELEGRLALKTGSVSSVQCYAGYMLDAETGVPTHVAVIMVNGFFCPRAQVRKGAEQLLLRLFTDSETEDK